MSKKDVKNGLITVLQNAHAGEIAAALAYEGHARAVRDVREQMEIKKIEKDEWQHRFELKKMLAELGAKPRAAREAVMWLIGVCVGISCRIGGYLPFGWFFAMYGAGKLESNNIQEYDHAAKYACSACLDHFVPCLLEMANTERNHEIYFRQKAESHFLWQHLPHWEVPPLLKIVSETLQSEKV